MKKQFLLMFVALLLASLSSWATTTSVRLYSATASTVGGIGVSTEHFIGTGSWKNDPASTIDNKMELYLPLTALGTFTINDIYNLQFSTKKVLPAGSNLDFYWSIYTPKYTGGDGTWYGRRLTSEPMYYNNYNAPYNVWNTYTTDDGTNQMTFFDSNHSPAGYSGAPTLADIQAGPISFSGSSPFWTSGSGFDYGSQTVMAISIATGSAWNASMEAYLDDIRITLNNGNVLIIDLEEKDPSPIVTIENPDITACGTLDVPVTVKDFKNLGSISMVMNFDPIVFEYQTPAGVELNPAISEADVNSSTPGLLKLGWFSENGITLADDETLFTLHLKLKPCASGASKQFLWSTIPGDCELSGPGAQPVYSGTFNNLSWEIPVRPVKNIETGLEYCKIQDALNASETEDGNHITVAVGLYPEQVTISKSIHLTGEVGAIIQAPVSLPAASDPLSNIVLVEGSGVSAEIEGFTIQGPGSTNCGSIGIGIFVRDGAYANIHDNKILDIRDNTFSGCQNGIAIQIGRNALGTYGTAAITNNIITGYQKGGIVVDNTGSSATITGNTITGAGTTTVTAQNGIQISRGATAEISGNTVFGNSFHIEGNTWDWGACGILLYQSGEVNLTGGNNLNNNDQNYYAYDVTGPISLGNETFGASTAPVTKGYHITDYSNQNVDASLCKFEGVDLSSATLTQFFNIEDRIWHNVDDPSKSGFVNVKSGNVYVTRTETGAHIQHGIDAATAGDIVNVQAGDYGIETASDRSILGTNGPHVFGLFIDKDNLTVRGYKSGDEPVVLASEAAVVFQTGSTANFGPSGVFVQANGVTLEGLKIGDNMVNGAISSNKTIEVIGDAFTFNKCFVNTSEDQGAFYMGRWDESHPVSSYNVTNNIFNNTLVSINNGVGISGNRNARVITGNTFTGVATPYLIGFRGWNGDNPAQGWILYPVGGAVITGNAFNNTGVDKYVIARGNTGGYVNSELNWADIWNLNTYGNHVVTLSDEATFDVRAYNDGSYPETRRISPKIQENVTIGQDGDVVLISAGTFNEQVVIDSKSLTLKGSGSANTKLIPSNGSLLSTFYTYPAGTFWPGTVMATTILVKNSSAVTVKDLKIDGSAINTLPIGASRLTGILFGESSGTIDGVEVNAIKTTDYAARSYGIDLSAVSSSQVVEVKNCTISDWGRTGIQAMGGSLTANIHNNMLVGPGTIGPNNVPNGIVFIHGVAGTAKMNTVSACHYTTTDWGSVGIMVYDPVQAGIVIEQNEVSDCDAGVALSMNANDVIVKLNNLHHNGSGIQIDDGTLNSSVLNNTIVSNEIGVSLNDAVGDGNKVEDNNISANTTAGLENASSTIVLDASPNWWGDATGPQNIPNNTCGLGNSVSSYVDFEPWYSDEAMTTLFYVVPTFSSIPGAVTVNQHQAKDPYATGTPDVTSCSTYILTYDDDRSGLNLCNATGSILRTWTATDVSGDIAICTQTITVVDNDEPDVMVPADITVNNDPGNCSAVVNFTPTATDFAYFQGFENADWIAGAYVTMPSTDWNEYASKLTRVASGTNSISSKSGSAHAIVTSEGLVVGGGIASNESGVFSRAGGYYNAFGDGYTSSVDVYFDVNDPRITEKTYGWDVSSAVNKQDGNHRRDFVFHVADDGAGGILVNADNGSSQDRRGDLGSLSNPSSHPVTVSGWYTLEWVFRNDGSNVLAVDLNLINSDGTQVWTKTLSDPSDLISTIVGGNRYMWFTFVAATDLAIDNTTLTRNLAVTASKASGTEFQKGTTTVNLSTFDACGHEVTGSFDVTIVDTEKPVITTCAPVQSAIVTDGCRVQMPDFVSSAEATDNCPGVLITQEPAAGTWMEWQTDPYTVTLTATDETGNFTSCPTTFTVEKASISGTLTYHQLYPTVTDVALNNVDLTLYSMPSHAQVGLLPVTTGSDGSYTFGNLCAGDYSIEVTRNEKGVGGINSTDASAANAWGAFSGETIEYVQFLAGDVKDNDLFMNTGDAQRIQKFFVFGMDFDRAPWSYWKKGVTITDNYHPYSTFADHPTNFNVSVSGSNVADFDLYGMCTGDFNGSFVPDALKSATWSVELSNNSIISAQANQDFELPIIASSSMEIGAISLIIKIPSELVMVKDVLVKNSNVTADWIVNGDELRIGWYSSTTVNVAENGSLLTLKLTSTSAFTLGKTMQFALKFDPLNELADGNSDVIQNASLLVAEVGNGVTGIHNPVDNSGLSLINYPNPFKGYTMLEYNLPVDGKVTVQVYNSLGQLVKSVVDANQNAGNHTIRMESNDLMPGIYIARLRLTNLNVDLTGNVKLSVLK
ncbi:MAG: right-handed parallel beta-helix repeat-containing protein [Prolixibacteraceae bacterium]